MHCQCILSIGIKYSANLELTRRLHIRGDAWREMFACAGSPWRGRGASALPAACPADSLAPLRACLALYTANSVGMEGAGRRGALFVVLALAAGE